MGWGYLTLTAQRALLYGDSISPGNWMKEGGDSYVRVGEKNTQARGITVLKHRDGRNLVGLEKVRNQKANVASDK